MWEITQDRIGSQQPLLDSMFSVVSNYCNQPTRTPTPDLNYTLKVSNVLNYPNPVNPDKYDLNITYTVQQPIKIVDLKIYSYGLRLVKEQAKVPDPGTDGKRIFTFNRGYLEDLANGMYLCVIEVTDENGKKAVSQIKPLIIMR